jgi:hypothetical protein
MKSEKIIDLLRKKHEDDVFHTEVSIDHGSRRMDAWAMKKSWSNPLVIAYEVKISRSDFLHDHKLQDYLPYCNEMYMVCPKEVVKEDELPNGFGLMAVASTGNRIITKKKAPYRNVEIPEQFYRGLLMSKVDRGIKNMSATEIELARRVGLVNTYKDYVEGRKALSELVYKVLEKFKDLQKENQKLQQEIKAIEKSVEIHERIKKIMGKSYTYYLNQNYDDILAELVDKKLHQFGHPELEIVKMLEQVEEQIKSAKNIFKK